MRRRKLLSIGIDVSKDALVVAFRSAGAEESCAFPNTQNGITALMRSIGKQRCPIVMESTGRYHILAAFLLMERGHDVRVINPIMAKRYISASVRKIKTDKSDASALAHMGQVQTDLPAFHVSALDIQIRQKMGLIALLEKKLQALQRALKTYVEFQESMNVERSTAEQSIAEIVKTLQEQKDALGEEVSQLIGRDAEKKEVRDIACSIPGISTLTGSLLAQMLSRTCESSKQWIAFFGLDVSKNESGKTKRRERLSKRGNAYLRKRLYSAGWGAIMNYEQFRTYYETLKEKGHSHRAAVVIVARKLLRILFSLLKNNTSFSWDQCSFG